MSKSAAHDNIGNSIKKIQGEIVRYEKEYLTYLYQKENEENKNNFLKI